MSHEAKVHEVQTAILRELLFVPSASFSDLRKKTNLDSDYFKFHIARLNEVGYISKTKNSSYTLTAAGKEYANKLDTDRNIIERQPKSAVIIVLMVDGKVLVQERHKHPYFGFWGYPGGKIRWGETIMDAADRELKEETGLRAELTYRGVYHEQVVSAESGEILEDKIFHVINANHPSGKLSDTFEGGRNAWKRLEELETIKKKYASTDIETKIGLGQATFIEKAQTYSSEDF